MIGCGYWGPNLIRNFYENESSTVKYVCDLNAQALTKISKRYPTLVCTTNLDEVLQDPEVDAVVIATPVHTHHPLARKALLAGKHVFIEKPMCMNSSECLDLIALAEERQLTLMVDHTFVYHGAVRTIKEVVKSGDLGDILYFDSVRINLGLFQSDINVVWDLAPHDLSIMDYILEKIPVSVHAVGSCHTGTGLEDITYVTFKFADNLISHLHVSWLSPVKIRQTLIGGTKKMIVYDDLQTLEKIRVYNRGISVSEPIDEDSRRNNLIQYRLGDMHSPTFDLTEALQNCVKEFVTCALEKRRPTTDGLAGLRVVRMLEAIEMSLKTGETQQLGEFELVK